MNSPEKSTGDVIAKVLFWVFVAFVISLRTHGGILEAARPLLRRTMLSWLQEKGDDPFSFQRQFLIADPMQLGSPVRFGDSSRFGNPIRLDTPGTSEFVKNLISENLK